MRRLLVAAVVVAVVAEAALHGGLDGRIQHVIVVMEENRSFDHMLGYLSGVNGIKNGTSNPINVTDPAQGVVKASATAQYINSCDPDHSTMGTLFKCFGQKME